MATPIHLWSVLSESKRIINAHSRHFIALSLFFLLPLSFSLVVSPTLFHLLSLSPNNSSHIHILLRTTNPSFLLHHHAPFNLTTLLIPLSFSLFLLFLSLSSLTSITNSIFHGFFGRPVKLPSALKSIFPSFLPLLITTLLSKLFFLFIISLFSLFFHSLFHNNLHLTLLFLLPLLLLLLYLRVSWTLASVVVVVESTYGFEPLNRSAKLMKGMKGVGLSSFLFFGFMEGVLVWSGSVLTMNSGDGTGDTLFKDWAFVVHTVLASTLLMLLLLYNVAVDTVLYMYCKAVHGELAVEIVEEFAREYVSLPFDEGKIPHVVSVVHV